MKKSSVFLKILGILWALVWRIALTVMIIAVVIVAGIAVILNTIFTGPSDTARNQLTTTLLEYEATSSIPYRFLSSSTIDDICAAEDTLPAVSSDPSMITAEPLNETAGRETETIEGKTYSAEIMFIYDPTSADVSVSGNENYAGFTDSGVLVLSTSSAEAEALELSSTCGKILIMNGQVNDGLFNSNSGYAPRSAIGQMADGTLILINMNGGSWDCPGGTLQDLINIMKEYGAVNACCIDVYEG